MDILRKQLNSPDFFLSGKCMVALARLGDEESIPQIESIVKNTGNARLIIHGATALEIFHSIPSLPVLLGKLEKRTAPFLRDEIILSMAGILDMEDWFYPIYNAFLEHSSDGIAMLQDYIEQSKIEEPVLESVKIIVTKILTNPRTEFINEIEKIIDMLPNKIVSQVFMEAVNNPQLESLDRLFFLITAAVIRLLTRKE